MLTAEKSAQTDLCIAETAVRPLLDRSENNIRKRQENSLKVQGHYMWIIEALLDSQRQQ
jgi:hypothetical protein